MRSGSELERVDAYVFLSTLESFSPPCERQPYGYDGELGPHPRLTHTLFKLV